jgi:hypothetical protein
MKHRFHYQQKKRIYLQDRTGMKLSLRLNMFQQGMKNKKQQRSSLMWVKLRMFQQGKVCMLK